MKKPQYVLILGGVILLALLLAFGRTAPKPGHSAGDGHEHSATQNTDNQATTSSLSIDTLLSISKKALTETQLRSLSKLEQSAEKANSKEQQLIGFHGLAHFWRDSAKSFVPFAWYTAEGARLENSEKNLNFAGHLFLDRLQQEDNTQFKTWMALQAKDLFERSLSKNPNSDSAKVALGATLIFGGIAPTPMEGITKVREVLDKDSTNIYAQLTMAYASLMSGQLDKAQERLDKVIRMQPENLQALLMSGDLAERQGDKKTAIDRYSKALGHIERNDIKTELENRILDLKK